MPSVNGVHAPTNGVTPAKATGKPPAKKLGHAQTTTGNRKPESGSRLTSAGPSAAPDKAEPANEVNPTPPQEQSQGETVSAEVCQRDVSELTPHPAAAEIYGDSPGPALVASIQDYGVLQPLQVTPDGVVLSGALRLAASKAAGLTSVPVITVHHQDAAAEVEHLLHCNRQRVKTNEQIAREAAALMKIETERAHARQVAGKKKVPANSPEAGDARAIVGRQLGIGAKKVDQLVAVAAKIDQLKGDANAAEAENLRNRLNKSAHSAYQRVQVLDARAKTATVSAPASDSETESGPDEESTAKESKADILTRIQEDVVDGLEGLEIPDLLRFETALAGFRTQWLQQHGKEVA